MKPVSRVLNRRAFLRLSAGLASSITVLAACAPATPTVAPAQPRATEPPVVKATEPPVKAKEKVLLRVGAWEFADRQWMAEAPIEYAQQHPEIDVEVETIIYAESFTKALTGAATGTLPDVFYAPVRWSLYAAYKGAFLYLDDMIEAKDPGMDKWFPSVMESQVFEGKMYGLPAELHPGRPTSVYYNKDLLAAKGVAEPTDDWTMDEFAEMASKVTDRPNNIFGTSFYPTAIHDFICMARTMGGDAMSEDGREFTFNSDPGSIAAARWQVDLRTMWDAIPGREEREGLQFYAGLFGFMPNTPNIIKTVDVGVGDKFDWDVVLMPTGPTGLRGSYAFILSICVAATTAHPAESYDLAMYMTSEDVMKRALLEQGHNTPIKSLWLLPDAHPIWKKTHDFLTTSTAPGHWPNPWNLLFEELNDKFTNMVPALWYGEAEFEKTMQEIHDECQLIMSKPRP